ncbi:hypothetical protein [Marinobacterium nitratireducens]|uniref:hypothetical protein n=1 Tax=Marinobacterium nitratireducens TaxID=518897 RepID=UPI00166294D2|nr:hypothetical protein [Marinobacterium nitratireducens]
MKLYKLIRRLVSRRAVCRPVRLDRRTRQDVGFDAMAAEHLDDERLWRLLAA